MGSGSSARRPGQAEGAAGSSPAKGEAKYKVSRIAIDEDEAGEELPPLLFLPRRSAPASVDEDDGRGNVRPCDRCGETRKTARFGGVQSQWLCAACQLEGGGDGQPLRPAPRQPRRLRDVPEVEGPQPLRRACTVDSLDGAKELAAPTVAARRRKQFRSNSNESIDEEGPVLEAPEANGRSRRGAKERALALPGERHPAASGGGSGDSPPTSPSGQQRLNRASTVSLNVVEERHNYRSLRGLTELKVQMGVGRGPAFASDVSDGESSPKQVPVPASRKKKLGSGFSVGDRVTSLISRVRGGLLVLELGHEGTVVGARGGGGAGDEELRLLVQFTRGFDWLLPPCQVCPAASLGSAKAAGLPGFNWGTRVRSLVTYMRPAAAKRELWLGDAGTVIGPGLTPGKLAVRFDEGCGEWSVWPSCLCEADAYAAVVQEKLAGGLCRGDRVKARCRAAGSRSCAGAAAGPHALSEGEEGTVVGSGHAAGRLLVHFDADERMWSISAELLAAC